MKAFLSREIPQVFQSTEDGSIRTIKVSISLLQQTS